MNRKSQKKSFFCHRRKGGHGGGLSSNGALPWRKWRLRPSRRPWLVSPIALTRLSPPLTTRCFRRPACPTHSNLPGSRACRHRTSTRTGSSCACSEPFRTGTAPGRYSPVANGPLCAQCFGGSRRYLSPTATKKPSRLEWHVHPPYIPIRHRRAGSCAPIDRLHSAYGSWVFVSTSLVQELIWPCNDYDIVGRREPA